MTDEPYKIPDKLIESENRKCIEALDRCFVSLGKRLAEQGIGIGHIVAKVRAFGASVPSWGTLTGGTRFASFPIEGQPRDVLEKIDDAACAHRLTRANPAISLHIPWDMADDWAVVKRRARERGLGFDAINSNVFEDQPGQKRSYKFGSLTHVKKIVRHQAITHHLEVIDIGAKLGAKAINVWIGDGANFPGQVSIRESFERYLDSLKKIYKAMPKDWTMLVEYKPFEPAFYYTVLADWGSALIAAQTICERCKVLVDLGHHLPNANVEMIVARLLHAGKLGGFHFNDNKYADDDLTAGSIDPYRLFRIFHELVVEQKRPGHFKPAYMIDQSHNVKDPIEAIVQSTVELQNAYAKALIVNHQALKAFQNKNDAVMAEMEMKRAFDTDISPVTAMARQSAGGAIDPIGVYRASGYRKRKAEERGG